MTKIIFRLLRNVHASRRSAVTLEFSLVSIPFFILVLGAMEVGYNIFVQGALNYAVAKAARSIQVGILQGTAANSGASLAASSVCPALSGILSCSNIIVGVKPIPTGSDYYSAGSTLTLSDAASESGAACTGTAGQMMLLSAWYTGPTFVGTLIPSFATIYNGALVHITMASAGFVNEPFTGGQSMGGGC